MRHIGIGTTEIGGIETDGAGGVEFEDADVGVAVVGAVVGSERCRVAVAEDESRGVGVLVGVVASCSAPVVGRRPRVGREVEIGVDDERLGCVVASQFEAEASLFEAEASLDFALCSVDNLVGVGSQFDDVDNRGVDHDVAVAEAHALGALVADADGAGVGAWVDNEVVLHGVAGGIDLEVDTAVEVVVQNRLEDTDIRGPAALVSSEEVVFVSGLPFCALDACRRAALEAHAVGVGAER